MQGYVCLIFGCCCLVYLLHIDAEVLSMIFVADAGESQRKHEVVSSYLIIWWVLLLHCCNSWADIHFLECGNHSVRKYCCEYYHHHNRANPTCQWFIHRLVPKSECDWLRKQIKSLNPFLYLLPYCHLTIIFIYSD